VVLVFNVLLTQSTLIANCFAIRKLILRQRSTSIKQVHRNR